MKYPQLIKKHFSLNCIFPLKKCNVFFNKQYPYKLCRNPLEYAAFALNKRNLLPNDMVSLQVGNIPVPYEACFSIYSNLFNMQNSWHKVQCWKMTMLLTHGKRPTIRQYSILFNEPCSCRNRR